MTSTRVHSSRGDHIFVNLFFVALFLIKSHLSFQNDDEKQRTRVCGTSGGAEVHGRVQVDLQTLLYRPGLQPRRGHDSQVGRPLDVRSGIYPNDVKCMGVRRTPLALPCGRPCLRHNYVFILNM